MTIRRIFSTVFICISIFLVSNFTDLSATMQSYALTSQPIGITTAIEGRTIQQLRDQWENFKPIFTESDIYLEKPLFTAPYNAGKLKSGFILDGIRTANFARFLTGLPSDLVQADELTVQAQHGALLLSVSQYSHTPPKPADMEQSMYSLGYSSTSSSNIAAGAKDIQTTVKYYMRDFGLSNLSRVGHRRWILNPQLKKTTFGFVDGFDSTRSTYSTMQVFDSSRTERADYDTINWPVKGLFPVDFHTATDPWSISLNPLKYQVPNLDQIVVKVKRLSDQRVWTLDKSCNTVSGDDNYLTVDYGGYGVSNCIIFRPGKMERIMQNDVFEVNIQGIKDIYGADKPITYTTSFFSLVPVEKIQLDKQSIQGAVGSGAYLQSKVFPENASQKETYWTSSDPAIAKVNEYGGITITGPGNAVVKISTYDGTVSAECMVEGYIDIDKLTMDKTQAQLAVGETVQNKVSIFPETATRRTVKWTSSNPNVAIVDNDGNVTALADGDTQIKATASNNYIATTCYYHVYTRISSLSFSNKNMELKVKSSTRLTLGIEPKNAASSIMDWTTSNPAVATVDKNGYITVVGPGNAVVKVSTYNGSVSAECQIEGYIPIERLTPNKNQEKLAVGEAIQNNVSIFPENATRRTLKWSSSNPNVATVDNNGNVTAVADGFTDIKVTTVDENIYATTSYQVFTRVSSLNVVNKSIELQINSYTQPVLEYEPKNAALGIVNWTSSNSSVASIDEYGNIKAISPGTTVITASTENNLVKAECTVTVFSAPNIVLGKKSISIKQGKSIKQTAKLTGFIRDIDSRFIWRSMNPLIAKVDKNGNIWALKPGNVTIIVNTADGKIAARFIVSVKK